MKLLRIAGFRAEHGHCYIAQLPEFLAPGDYVAAPDVSQLHLFEDEVELGPPHSSHEVIRQDGGGAFSHWGRNLYFSSSDNSDPARNGRTYRVMAPAIAELRTPSSARGPFSAMQQQKPVNYDVSKQREENAIADAEYALQVANVYASLLPGGRKFLDGKTVLEIGPGPNFGSALVLKCWGAKNVAVADRFLAHFNPGYHTSLYSELTRLLQAEDPALDVSPLKECMAQKDHAEPIITCLEAPLETLGNHYPGLFDLTLSNAVLEHLFDPLSALKALFNITASGGIGYHQVDFRDHRDFSRPLEYLLFDELSFARLFRESHGECGNRLRPYQMETMFHAAGFGKVEFHPNTFTEPQYLRTFLPRLRHSLLSPFAGADQGALVEIGGRFVVEKP